MLQGEDAKSEVVKKEVCVCVCERVVEWVVVVSVHCPSPSLGKGAGEYQFPYQIIFLDLKRNH